MHAVALHKMYCQTGTNPQDSPFPTYHEASICLPIHTGRLTQGIDGADVAIPGLGMYVHRGVSFSLYAEKVNAAR